MAQLFSPRANIHSRVVIFGVVALICGGSWATWAVYWSPYTTYVDVAFDQPVPFSHKHHVGDDGIDCRYCHTTVEKSAFAGLPSTDTCMTCHSQLWKDAPVLAPIRESLASNTPVHWNRVHDLPDYVYFNHSIHVAKGIGCSVCHGRVDQMPLTRKTQTLYMRWCLDCHRNPQNYIRPRDKIYDMAWQPARNQESEGEKLVTQYHVDTSGHLTNCSTCHR
jgi:Cytochrome c7 and related cytochrome c